MKPNPLVQNDNIIEGRLRDLTPFLRPLSGAGPWLAVGLFLGLLTLVVGLGLLGLSGALLTGAAIAVVTPATALLFNVSMAGTGIRLLAILRPTARWGERVATHEGIFRWLAGLRVWLYGRMARLSPRQISRFHGGELLNRLMRDIDALDNLYPRVLIPTVAATLSFMLMVIVFAAVAPGLLWLPLWLVLVAAVLLPVAGWRGGRTLLPRLVHERAALRTSLLDVCEGMDDLSLHKPAWTHQQQLTVAASEGWLATQTRSARRVTLLRAAIAVGVGLTAWAALGLFAAEPAATRLQGPWIAALILLLLGGAEALQPLAGACLELPGTAAAARRIQGIAQQVPSQQFVDKGPQPKDAGIRIQGLRFEWNSHTPVLRDFDLIVRSGEHLLLAGESGCGKSTLVQLLTRFEDPQAGSILIGDVELASLDETTLRRHIACASQFTWAKTATLADNLRLARPDATDAELHATLCLVGLNPEAQGWQSGLQTWVEEGGASLSGGQRKRLDVARALLRDAPITVLDEPSEGLDSQAAERLLREVTDHLRGRTLIWISHRESMNNRFDRVVQLQA